MPRRFRVEWTDAARRDFESNVRFIAKDSLINATKVYKRIRERANTLRTFPDRGHSVRELADFGIMNYYELSVLPYRLIYRVQKPKVFVHAVLDGRRDLKEILTERLLRAGD